MGKYTDRPRNRSRDSRRDPSDGKRKETEIDPEKRKEIDLETEIDPGRKEEKDPEIDHVKDVEADQENVEKTMINTRAQNINVHHIVPGLYCKLQITCIWLF